MNNKNLLYIHSVANTVLVSAPTLCSGTVGGHYEKYNQTCILIGFNKTTWYEARNLCLQDNGDLLELDSQETRDTVVSLIQTVTGSTSEYFWRGLQRRQWMWQDGKQEYGLSMYSMPSR